MTHEQERKAKKDGVLFAISEIKQDFGVNDYDAAHIARAGAVKNNRFEIVEIIDEILKENLAA